MSVRCGLGIDGRSKVETLLDEIWPHVENLFNYSADLTVIQFHFRRSTGVYI